MRVVFHGTAVRRADGAVVPGAEVEVRLPNGAQAEIYNARTGGALLSNPFFADPDGDIIFYAEPGRYHVVCHDGNGNTQELENIILTSEFAFDNPLLDVGDLIIGGTGGQPTRLPVGTDGQALTIVDGVPAWV